MTHYKDKAIHSIHGVGVTPSETAVMCNQSLSATPFASCEDAWFWFVAAQQAKSEGARITANMGKEIRPCEPLDILKILDRLYRNRILTMHHFKVLRHYGRRGFAPDPSHERETRAVHLWREAFMHLEPIFVRKGIVAPPDNQNVNSRHNWEQDAIVYSQSQSQTDICGAQPWM